MMNCYLDNNAILDVIDISDNNVKITFIEPAGSGYIKTLQDQIEEHCLLVLKLVILIKEVLTG